MTALASELLDTFNRANENPLSNNARWSAGTPAASTGLKLVSNQAVRQDPSGTFGRNGSFRNDVTVGAGQSCAAWHTVGNAGSDGGIDVGFFNSSSSVGYELSGEIGSFGSTYAISRYDATPSPFTPVKISGDYSRALTTSDRAALWIDGTDIVGVLDIGSGWTEILRVADTTYRPAWTPYWEIAGFADVSSAAIDDATVAISSRPIALDVPVVYLRRNR